MYNKNTKYSYKLNKEEILKDYRTLTNFAEKHGFALQNVSTHCKKHFFEDNLLFKKTKEKYLIKEEFKPSFSFEKTEKFNQKFYILNKELITKEEGSMYKLANKHNIVASRMYKKKYGENSEVYNIIPKKYFMEVENNENKN